MRRMLKPLWTGTRWCVACVFSFALWTVWLALAALFAIQVYIATHRELEVPGFLLRSLEERLAVSGVRATFGRTSFDPTGRVLIENVRLSLADFTDPVVTARTVYVRLDPWSLAAGQFEPSEVRVSGASFAVPALLSPSGRADEILRDLDVTVIPHEKQLELAQLTGRIAGISLLAHGAVALPPRNRTPQATSLPTADFLARNYVAISRQLVTAARQLAVLDRPSLRLELEPSETRVALASLTLFAEGLKFTVPQPVEITGLHATTKFPLLGDAPVTARLEVTADSVALPFDARIRHLHTVVRGTLTPGRLQFVPEEMDLAFESLTAKGFSARSVTTKLAPGSLPRLSADISALITGSPLAVHVDADLAAQTATVRFRGAISPEILPPLSDLIHVDVRKYFDFAEIHRASGEARLGPGWKFENLSARLELRGINAYHVIMEEGLAVIDFDGHRLFAPEAYARIGDNYARGTYEQDFATRDYRFLLEGRLRPLDISGWFHEWWPNFFNQLEFPVAPPEASVEVSGRWASDGRRSLVYVFADTTKPIIRGAALDRLRTRLLIRPGFFDGPEMFVTHPTGTAQGTFTYSNEPGSGDWRTLDLDLVSDLDPSVAVKILGAVGESIFSPFKWSAPPKLKVAGRIDGVAAPAGPHTTMRIEGTAAGEFRFRGFPLTDVAFSAALRDDDIEVTSMQGKFAEGVLAGRVKIFGAGADRRVNFDYALKEANLGRVIAELQGYSARKTGTPPTAPNKFMQEKAAVHIDLNAAAEGRYDDTNSYHGAGQATLNGPGLGEVQLLGQLSELFTFTVLRFTSAHSTFKIDGSKLTFPDLVLRGANSAIDAHGDFLLERRELDFKARILPFQESSNPIKSLVGTVLTPLSNIFEVKLTGTLDKPAWAFAPGSLFRSNTPGEGAPATSITTPASSLPTPAPPPADPHPAPPKTP